MGKKNASVEKFTEDDRQELVRLLKKMKADLRSDPVPAKRGFLPNGVFEEIHGLVSMWATELVVTRGEGANRQLYLTRYDGGVREFRNTWNIPGGYNQFSEETIDASVLRIGKREMAQKMEMIQVIGADKWRSDDGHPYGRPLSLYVACRSSSALPDTDIGRFFSVSNLPDTLCGVHRRFIEGHF